MCPLSLGLLCPADPSPAPCAHAGAASTQPEPSPQAQEGGGMSSYCTPGLCRQTLGPCVGASQKSTNPDEEVDRKPSVSVRLSAEPWVGIVGLLQPQNQWSGKTHRLEDSAGLSPSLTERPAHPKTGCHQPLKLCLLLRAASAITVHQCSRLEPKVRRPRCSLLTWPYRPGCALEWAEPPPSPG